MLITRRRFLVSGAASMALWSLGCTPSGRAGVPAPISPPQRRASMRTDQWQTWCVGRNLIDLPAGATVIDTNNEGRFIPGFRTKIDGHLFRRLPGVNAEQAHALALQRAKEIKAQAHETEGNMLIGTHSLANGALIIHRWRLSYSTNFHTAEVYFVAQNSKDLVCTYAEDFSPENWDKAVRWFTQVGDALHALAPGEIPTVPGFCGDGFIIKDTRSGREEFAGLVVHLPLFPKGLRFVLNAATSTPSRKGLADNPDVMEEGCINLGNDPEVIIQCDTLRNGRHKVGPIDAYEICVAGKVTTSPVRLYSFYWQTPGEPFSYAVPIMEADLLYTVGTIEAFDDPRTVPGCFFTDQEALDLWDAIINSIRIRPGAVDPNYTKLVEE